MSLTHPEHSIVVLSLSSVSPDGHGLFRGWTMCSCKADEIASTLGHPHRVAVATPEALAVGVAAFRSMPGIIDLGRGPAPGGA